MGQLPMQRIARGMPVWQVQIKRDHTTSSQALGLIPGLCFLFFNSWRVSNFTPWHSRKGVPGSPVEARRLNGTRRWQSTSAAALGRGRKGEGRCDGVGFSASHLPPAWKLLLVQRVRASSWKTTPEPPISSVTNHRTPPHHTLVNRRSLLCVHNPASGVR